ncbi:MAG TPA: SpoIIE family protein phosphatase [Polyangia bacterium]
MNETQGVFLEVNGGGVEGYPSTRIRLRSGTSVGRDEDNDISFGDTMLSRRHAEFRQRNGLFYVVDLDSSNGTYVNNIRVHGERRLADGDVVTLGGTPLVFRETELPTPGETANLGVVRAEFVDELTPSVVRTFVDVTELGHEDRGLSVVCQATNALVAHHPLPELFDRVLEAILDAIPGQRAAMMLLDGQSSVPTLKATRTRSGAAMGAIRRDMVMRALAGREAFLVRDIFENTEVRNLGADPIGSVMCAPLRSTSNGKDHGRVLGMIYLDSQSDRPPLTDRDLHIFIMMANITATKIENARLLDENLQKQRFEEDMRIAEQIQSDLLPRSSPQVAGYRVYGTTEPCRMVGGDYFDFEHDGRNLHMVLADVSGKGTGAAMLMVALRATVRAHWRDGTLTEVATRINRTFHQTVPADKFATCFLARLDAPSGCLDYVNAGHNHPLLIRPNGQWCTLEAGGTVLGAFPEATYEQGTVVMEPGACLLVFSDGVSDAWSDHDEAARQLVSLVLARKPGDAAALRAEIFHAGERAKDDRTLIILERRADDLPE